MAREMADVKYVRVFNDLFRGGCIVTFLGLIMFGGGLYELTDQLRDRSSWGIPACIWGGLLTICGGLGLIFANPIKYRVIEYKDEEEPIQPLNTIHVAKSRRSDYEASAIENRMWCPECSRYVLARRKRQYQNATVAGQIFSSLFGLVCAFLLFGLIGIIIISFLVALFWFILDVASIFNLSSPVFLCTTCGYATSIEQPINEGSP